VLVALAALEIGFKGIGFYPLWNNPGFHVDMREREHTLLWVKTSHYVYSPEEFFKRVAKGA